MHKVRRILRVVGSSATLFLASATLVTANSPDHEGGEVQLNGQILSIKEGHRIRGIKRSVVVRLSEPISETALRTVANRIHDAEPDFKRTFIVYLLPEMREGSGAWATTNFDPDLNVTINGLKADDKTTSDLRDVSTIGHWFVPYLGYHIWIHKRGDGFILERKFTDGSSGVHALNETRHPNGRRFDLSGESAAGDYFIVTRSGHLERRDEVGLIDKLRPAKTH